MTRRSLRRTAAVLVTAGMAAGLIGLSLGGSASAEVPSRTHAQVATPPPPGSGIQITIVQPKPVGPLSFL
jgi:hypothetical protein